VDAASVAADSSAAAGAATTGDGATATVATGAEVTAATVEVTAVAATGKTDPGLPVLDEHPLGGVEAAVALERPAALTAQKPV
jgi:hypothetical protein